MLTQLVEYVLAFVAGMPILGAVYIVEQLDGWMGFIAGGPIITIGIACFFFISSQLPPVQRAA